MSKLKLPEIIISPVSYDIYYRVNNKDQYISGIMKRFPESLRYEFWTYDFFISRGFKSGDLSKIEEYEEKSKHYYKNLFD